jgi:RIO kinase 1
MLERDVNNMTAYYGLYAPELLTSRYAEEMWALYESGDLHPESELTGLFEGDEAEADVDAVLMEIQAAMKEEEERLARIQTANESEV